MIRQSFEHSPAPSPGLRHDRAGDRRRGSAGSSTATCGPARPEELPGLVRELVDWALGYQRPESEDGASGRPRPRPSRGREAAEGNGEELDWKEPPDSPRSRAELTQRERIVRAVGRLVVEKGFETLSIPAISATAGTSNQTFYEHFGNKREAFLAAFDVSAAEGLAATTDAFESAGRAARGGRRRAARDARAHRRQRALRPLHLLRPADGRPGRARPRRRGDGQLHGVPAARASRPAQRGRAAVADRCVQAVGSGIWSVIQHELAHGQAESLPGAGTGAGRGSC